MKKIKQIQVPKAPSSPLYSQAIAAGGFLFLSGQIGLDPASGKIVEGGVLEQMKRIFINIENILKGAGLDLTSLVRIEIYLKNIEDLAQVNTLYAEKIPHPLKPVRQAMQVGNLPFDALIEISGIALCETMN